MTESSSTHPEQGEQGNFLTIDGENVQISLPAEHFAAIPEIDEMIIPRSVTNAAGETELWAFKGMGELASGTKVEIVQDAKGNLHLMRAEQPSPTAESDTPAEANEGSSVEQTPAKKKMGGGIMSVLRGFVKPRIEASGPDPDAVPRVRTMHVIDPVKGKVGEINVLPDHLNDNRM